MSAVRPSVSVILVNYNGFEDTVDCVKSLKKITYDNYRVIVVDNGSSVSPTKEQLDYLREHTDYVSSGGNLGFSGGNNFGMKYAEQFKPDYYLLLNNDTTVEPDFLDILVDEAEKHSDAGIVTGKIRLYDEPDRIWYAGGYYDLEQGFSTHEKYEEIDDDLSDRVDEVTFATGCLWLLPVKVVQEVGMMDESMFLYAEDTEYSCRLITKGYKIYYCNRAVIYHKVSRSTGKTSDNTLYYTVRNNLQVIRLYGTKKRSAYLRNYRIWGKSILRGRMKFAPVYSGVRDFIRHIDGERKKSG